MWFVRDLFIVSLLSPLVFAAFSNMSRRFSYVTIFILAGIFIIMNTQIPFGSLAVALVCFSIGAIMGLHRMVIVVGAKRIAPVALIVFMALAAVHTSFMNMSYAYIVEHILVVVGAVIFVAYTSDLPKSYRGVSLPSLSMFVFASHAIHRFFAIHICMLIGIKQSWIDFSLRFALTVGLCLFCYLIGKKICPRLLSLSVGGR